MLTHCQRLKEDMTTLQVCSRARRRTSAIPPRELTDRPTGHGLAQLDSLSSHHATQQAGWPAGWVRCKSAGPAADGAPLPSSPSACRRAGKGASVAAEPAGDLRTARVRRSDTPRAGPSRGSGDPAGAVCRVAGVRPG